MREVRKHFYLLLWLKSEGTVPQNTESWYKSDETNFAVNGRIRLSVSTVNRTYELSGITHVTSFRKYGKHSTGPSTYGPCVRTYSKLFSCKSVLTVCSYRAQSNEIHTYGRVSRGSIPRVRRYGLLYLRTVEYDQWWHLEWASVPPMAKKLSQQFPFSVTSQELYWLHGSRFEDYYYYRKFYRCLSGSRHWH